LLSCGVVVSNGDDEGGDIRMVGENVVSGGTMVGLGTTVIMDRGAVVVVVVLVNLVGDNSGEELQFLPVVP
jgi:hypothetical protein